MLLPADKVRHVGEAVAMAMAETAAQAQDAAEAVIVEYRGVAVGGAGARKRCGPAHRWCGTRRRTTCWSTLRSAMPRRPERAFAVADHIVEMEFHIGRVTGVPIEPRAALGHWDAETGRYTL